VEVQENMHNHGPVATLSALLVYRIAAMLLEEKEKVKKMQSLCHTPKQILQALQQDNLECSLVPQDIYNLLANL
jgi:ABC-type iron transport system FetAB permease component